MTDYEKVLEHIKAQDKHEIKELIEFMENENICYTIYKNIKELFKDYPDCNCDYMTMETCIITMSGKIIEIEDIAEF